MKIKFAFFYFFSLAYPFRGSILNKVGSYSRTSRWLQDRKRMYFIVAGGIFCVMLGLVFYDLSQPVQTSASEAVLILMVIIFFFVAFYFIISGYRVYKAITAATNSGENATAQLVTICFSFCIYFPRSLNLLDHLEGHCSL